MPAVAAYSTIDLSAFMGVSLPLQLDKVEYEARPLVDPDVGRFLTAVTINGEGFIQLGSQGAFDAAVAALSTATAVSGTGLTVTDLGGSTLHQVLPANCVEGGPHVGFAILGEGSGVWYRRVRFRLEAKTVGPVLVSSYKLSIRYGPDGLARVSQVGAVGGPNAAAAFTSGVLAPFASAYEGGGYVVEYQVDYPYAGDGGSAAALLVRYSLRAEQLSDPLPAGGPAAGVVGGEATVRTDRDEQQRLVSQFEFDLTLTTASYQSLVSTLRNEVQGQITRETVSYTSVRQRRLRCSFTTLAAADQGALLSFTQTLSIVTSDDAFEEFSYPGADPIAVQLPDAYARVTQSGSATGLVQFPQPPDPLLQNFERRPTKRFVDLNPYEKTSEWEYQFLDVEDGSGSDGGPDVASLLVQIGRQSVSGFYPSEDSGDDDTGEGG